ncbi:hypothetical protein P9D28_09030 [Bacillus haynesii]|uniref:hypothetical protein n=1 Tax=Bacillus haynesii TaxID=1925021 RepID=UPI002DBC075C|nr:hypothetical protein [Bacillus haynesii]MEC1552569.1 hypothetical protein [Bacillus haynesii]
MLKKGDRVVMHSNLQARINSGVIWTCECDEFLDYRGNTVVRLKEFGDFYTAFLQKVDVEGMLGVALKRADRLQEENERLQAELELCREYFKKVHDELEKEDSADESVDNILRLNTQLLISLAALEAAE